MSACRTGSENAVETDKKKKKIGHRGNRRFEPIVSLVTVSRVFY